MTNAEMMIAYARAQVGKPYVFGASGPDVFDCSGLTMKAARLMGLIWYHGASTQYHRGSATGDSARYGYWAETGPIATLPPDKTAFLFHADANKADVMAHTGMYDGVTHHVIQAGGYGAKGVHEAALAKQHWTYWAIVKDADAEAGDSGTLSIGSKGASVIELQTVLNAAGAALEVDGNFGPLTQAALIAYQQAHGLTADGVCNSATWGTLNAVADTDVPEEDADTDETATHATIRRGSKGDDVTALQTLLNTRGATLKVDGIFGALTDVAVRDFQSKNGLKVDSIVGKLTWRSLLGVDD